MSSAQPSSNGTGRGAERTVAVEQRFPSTLSYGEFRQGVEAGKYPVVRNAADLVWKSLTWGKNAPRKIRGGLTEYPVFSDRTDGNAIYGLHRELDEVMRYIQTEAETGDNKSVLVLVGESGGAKSRILSVIEKSVGEYMRENPVYFIKGSQLNEYASALTTPDNLSPDALDVLDAAKSVDEVELERRVFKSGNGIVSVDATTMQKLSGPEAIQYWNDVRLKAAGGLLIVNEFVEQGDTILQAKDWLGAPDRRGRTVHDYTTATDHRVQTLAIGATTPGEMADLWKKRGDLGKSLKRRIREVYIGLNLEMSEEVKIYEQMLGNLTGAHRSPQLLEVAAEWAALTRVSPAAKTDTHPEVDRITKLRIYDGRPVEGITPEIAREIAREGLSEKVKDGRSGLSAVDMGDMLAKELAAAMYAEPGKQCLNPLTFLNNAIANLEAAGNRNLWGTDPYTIQANLGKEVKQRYEVWLVRTVLEAFTANYRARMGEYFGEYTNYIDPLSATDQANAQQDQYSRAAMDQRILARQAQEIEERLRVRGVDVPTFRNDLLQQVGDTAKERKADGTATYKSNGHVDDSSYWDVDKPAIRQLKEVLDELVAGGSIKAQEDLLRRYFDPQGSRKSIAPEDLAKVDEMKSRLCTEYGFCPHCVGMLARHAGTLLANGTTLADLAGKVAGGSARR